jgi:hypothetical protein
MKLSHDALAVNAHGQWLCALPPFKRLKGVGETK